MGSYDLDYTPVCGFVYLLNMVYHNKAMCGSFEFIHRYILEACTAAGVTGNPRGRLPGSVRGIRGIGLPTAQGHRGAGARREVTLHAAHAQHQHHSSGQVSAVCTLCIAVMQYT